MKVTMDHVAVMADDARELAAFYRDVIGLEPVVAPDAQNVSADSYKWLKLGDHEIHVVERDPAMADRLGVNIDPIHAHFAFRIDSTETREELIARLEGLGIEWMDWSPHGIPGKHQLFFRDPGGNLIEFQVHEAAA